MRGLFDIPFFSAILCLSQNNFQFIIFLCLTYYHWAFMFKKHILIWKDIEVLNKEEQQEAILNLLMKTISSRKRQYRKCQFCNEKVAIEHRFDKDTCHGCASQHFGVLY